jgi:hypothetical protein
VHRPLVMKLILGLYELGNIWNDMIMKYQLIKFILFMYYIFLCVCMYMYM